MSSIPDFNEYNKKILIEDLGSSSVDSMIQMEMKGQMDNPQYVRMEKVYAHKHMCRVLPYPNPMIRGFTHVNNSIMNTMLGPGTATFSGRLTNWDIKNRLHEIQVPTLIVGAKYDFMSPDHMKWMSTQVQHARYLYCPEGSHLAMWDDQKNFYPGIIQFIKDVDDGSFAEEK